jgi:hypothetical protein
MSKSYYIEDGLPTWTKAAGEIMDWTVGFTQWLDGLLIATPSVVSSVPAELIVTGAQVIAGGTAIKATLGGGIAGSTYLVHYTATVNASLVRIVTIRIKVVSDRA